MGLTLITRESLTSHGQARPSARPSSGTQTLSRSTSGSKNTSSSNRSVLERAADSFDRSGSRPSGSSGSRPSSNGSNRSSGSRPAGR